MSSPKPKPIVVYRLKNAPAGQPYAIESQSAADMDNASKVVQVWWSSRGTASVLVLEGDREDSRYEREWIDRERVPNAWVKRKLSDLEIARTAATPSRTIADDEDMAPTLFNDPEEQPEQQVRSAEGKCPCCLGDLVEYEGDSDPTPSGRLANHRCMQCGRPQPGVPGRAIYTQYMRYQSGLSRVHARVDKPWRPRRWKKPNGQV